MDKELIKAKQKLVLSKQTEIAKNLTHFFNVQEKETNQTQKGKKV